MVRVFDDVEYNFTDKWLFVSRTGAEKERKNESNLLHTWQLEVPATKVKPTYMSLKPLKPLIT
jgi:hypothetical protein